LRQTITSDDALAWDAPAASRRAPPAGLRLVARLACAAAAIAGLSLFAREHRPSEDRRAGEAPATAEASTPFVPSVGPGVRPAVATAVTAPRFRLDLSDAPEPVRAEPPRIAAAGGRREETLNQGAFPTIEAPYLRLVVGETGPGDPARTLFVTLARRAADGPGLSVIRTGERGRIETKFGAVETLEATFSGPLDRVCTGFAGAAGPSHRFEGWLCAPLGQAPEPRAVACALDALVAVAPEPGFSGPRDPACRPPPDIRTGSLAPGGTRKNEARLRRNAQARP
jgi:hypothetical protein